MTTESFPFSWKTFKGNNVSFDSIDHQHLSNVYWYTKLILEGDTYLPLRKASERFNGQILDYKPHADFLAEIDKLETLGYLTWLENSIGRVGTITYKGIVIGSIFNGL